MLMRCESCGKMFDYEKTDGVCPGCGQFCQPPLRADGAEPILPGPGTEEQGLATDTAPPRAAGSGWRAAFFALVLLWACVMAGGFALMRHRQAALPERAAFASPVADEVDGAFRRHGRVIAVTGAEVMGSEYRAGLPEEGCLVRVGLRLDETTWQSNSDEFYLQSGGCFYQATSTYYLQQVYPALAKDALDGSPLQSYQAQEGWLYFVLPGPPRDAALYLEQAEGYGSDRRVTGAATCPLAFVPAGTEGGEADG